MKSLRVGYKGAHEITGLPIGTLYSKVALKAIPHIRLGRRQVIFDVAELETWLAQHKVSPKQGAPGKPNG